MADDADRASELEERQRQDAFARWIKPFEGESLNNCDDCDAEIPQARREAIPGVSLCVECQQIEEKRNGGPGLRLDERRAGLVVDR